MTNLSRVRITFNGFTGSPGVATMYFLSAVPNLDAIHALWTGLGGLQPPIVHIQVQNTGDIIEDTSGDLVGAWSTAAVAPQVGLGGDAYAAPCGALVRWGTTGIADGHRIKGSNYVVPVSALSYEGDGTILAAALDPAQSSVDTFITDIAGDFVIWHRPFDGRPATDTLPARPAHDGSHHVVVAGTVLDKVVVLRSRRD